MLEDGREIARAEEEVHLRQLAGKLGAVALGEAARDDKPPAASLFLPGRHPEDLLDGFLPGGQDEGAGVDDDGFGPVGPVGDAQA